MGGKDTMKFLHTSDWHLGRSLYGRKRHDEYSAFLEWLALTIEKETVDVLLVAGDVFDTGTPGNSAQALYYRFLRRVSASCCRHVVVIAGNHDSPSFLNAPAELLRTLNVHVIGAATQNPADEVIPIQNVRNGDSNPGGSAIVCAVPYLRDKDIRTLEPGETMDDKNRKMVHGIQQHYAEIAAIAEQKRSDLCPACNIPIIAMGHLFAAGGRTVDGDGVRDLYVGSLVRVDKEMFPTSIDYVALGHLHVPQKVAEHIRYSGSPIPIGFGEADQPKQVVIIEFNNRVPSVRTVFVPCFQPLVRIVGTLDHILARMADLKREKSRAWLEIEVTDQGIAGSPREVLEEALSGSDLEIRRIKNRRMIERVLGALAETETLDDLDPADVFARCLDTFEVPEQEREDLIASYREIITGLMEEDKNAQ